MVRVRGGGGRVGKADARAIPAGVVEKTRRGGTRKGRKSWRLSRGVIKTLKVSKSPQTARNLQTRSLPVLRG